MSFVEERERVIHEQQEAMRELSTPVLQLRDRLLILPIIGVLDSARARQLTEQLLGGDPRQPRHGRRHRHHRASPRSTAPWPTTSSRPSRRRGSWARSTILTGLSSEIAQTLVDLGVDLGMMKTVGDLQGGLEEAERLAGYRDADASDANGDAAT